MKIKIKEQEVELKQTMRAIMLYESITNKNFETKTVSDIILYMYCIIVSSNKNLTLNFDEFIDYLDTNNQIFDEFNKFLIDNSKMNEDLESKETKEYNKEENKEDTTKKK